MLPSFVLTLSCADRPGIVAAVSGHLFEAGCNILDAQQFDDTETGLFFARIVFAAADGAGPDAEPLRAGFAPVAERFGMRFSLRSRAERRRVTLLVSRFDHCLADLLYRWRTGELDMDIVGIISNYPRETYAHLDFASVPFHHVPVSRATKKRTKLLP